MLLSLLHPVIMKTGQVATDRSFSGMICHYIRKLDIAVKNKPTKKPIVKIKTATSSSNTLAVAHKQPVD